MRRGTYLSGEALSAPTRYQPAFPPRDSHLRQKKIESTRDACFSAPRAAFFARCAVLSCDRPQTGQIHTMATSRPEIALIVGAGPGLSASLARLFSREGMRERRSEEHTSELQSR